MAKSVDAVDSKSTVAHPTCRFESGLRHQKDPKYLGSFFILHIRHVGATCNLNRNLNGCSVESGLRHQKRPNTLGLFSYHTELHSKRNSFFVVGLESPTYLFNLSQALNALFLVSNFLQ